MTNLTRPYSTHYCAIIGTSIRLVYSLCPAPVVFFQPLQPDSEFFLPPVVMAVVYMKARIFPVPAGPIVGGVVGGVFVIIALLFAL